jgi:very-short-patch-repair endonuclease
LLAIEIDGGYHDKRKCLDFERDKFMRNLNIETLRILNEDVLNNLNKVKDRIIEFIQQRKVSLFKGNVPKGQRVLNKGRFV